MDEHSQRLIASLQEQNAELQQQIAELQRSHHLLQAIVEGTTDAVFVKDLHGRYLMVNTAVTTFVGKPAKEILGYDDTRLFSAETAQDIMDRDRRVIESGQTLTDEEVGTAAGQTRTYLSTKGPFRDEQGRVIGIIGISRDVTERRRLELQLAERERRWRAMLDSEPECVKSLATDGTLLEMNRAGLAMVEAENAEQVLGHCVYPLVVPEHRQAFQALTERVFHGESGSLEFEMLTLKGGRLWLETHATPFRDESGQIVSLLSVTRDVTERRRAEQALRIGERKFAAIFHNSPVATALTTLSEGRIVEANEAYCRLLGYEREDLLGRTTLDLNLVDPIERSSHVELLSQGQTIRNLEMRYRHRSGQFREVLISAERLDIEGEPMILGISQDITDRKQAESELRANENRFRALVEKSFDAISLIDPDGAIRFVTPPATRILGYSTDEYLQLLSLDLFHPDDAPQAQRKLSWIAERPGQSVTDLNRMRHRDGSWRWIEGTATNLLHDPALHGIVVNFRDVTDRIRAEESLREREEQLRLFVQHSPAAIAMFDNDMRYLVASRRWHSDYGLGESSIIGRTHYEVFPEIPERWKVIHRRCLAGAVETCEEDPFVRADGHTDWIRWEVRPWTRASGEIGGLIMLTEVITARKKAALALRESELRFRTLVDQAADALYVFDFEGRYLDVNRSACESSGYSRDELLRMSVVDLAFGAPQGELVQLWNQLLPEHPVTIVGRHRRKDGSEFPVEVRLGLIDSESVRVVLAIVRDISERQRSEDAIRESQAMLQLVLDSIPQGVFWKNRDSVYLGANRVSRRAMGIDRAEAIAGLTDFDIPNFQHDQARFFVQKDREVMQADRPELGIIETMTLPNGETIWLETNMIPNHDSAGNVNGILGTWQDVTDRKRAEVELAGSRERLEVLSRQLIATQESERRHLALELHDEIGQALTGIKLNLKTLQQPEQAARSSTLVQDTIVVVDQTLQQVRSLALDLRPSMLDDIGLASALRWCLDRQSRLAGFAASFAASSSELRVSSDVAIACFRVAQESLTNIARHAQARNVTVELQQHDAELTLLVRDDGQGFDVTAARHRAARGGSLGLLGMEERVQLVCGQIEITSTPTGGTTIQAKFPTERPLQSPIS